MACPFRRADAHPAIGRVGVSSESLEHERIQRPLP